MQASGQIITYPAIIDLTNSAAHTFFTLLFGVQKCPNTPFSQGLVTLSKNLFSGEECGWKTHWLLIKPEPTCGVQGSQPGTAFGTPGVLHAYGKIQFLIYKISA